MAKTIDPKQLIKELSVEELNQTAEAYFQQVHDPIPHMAKPFSNPHETIELLGRMGLILSGLRLSKAMTVLEFGAGACWFSRFLNQLQCATISVDVSQTALDFGRRLFEEMPILGGSIAPPQFVVFDGHHMDVPDESVDRVLCMDAFHHVPNQRQVLSEIYRVLKPGGIASFNEPGRNHSQTPMSQYEMKNFKVLENDILLEEIKEMAEELGFTNIYVKPASHPKLNLTYKDYMKIVKRKKLPRELNNWIVSSTQNATIFFLVKGTPIPDSRDVDGLKHTIHLSGSKFTVPAGQPLNLDLRIRNTGPARWLHQGPRDIGVVKVGAHLYNSQGTLLDLDFYRHNFSADIEPNKEVSLTIAPIFPEPGQYTLALDLVSEQVCWFENMGSKPVLIEVQVQ
jgi:SAM-dependent methyltransferase